QSVSSGTTNAVGDTTTSTPAFSRLKVCKVGNVSGTFTVSAAPAGGGSPTVLSPITVAAGQCRIVAEDFDTATGVGGNITVTETSAGLQSISAQRIDAPAGTISSFTFTNGQTLFLNSFHGYTITFTNNVPPPPPPLGNGRFTGGGQIRIGEFRISQGLTIHCDKILSNNLEINWPGGNNFKMEEHLTTVECSDNPAIIQAPPAAPLDTLIGTGVGRFNNVDGYTVEFTLIDYGEPGDQDKVALKIFRTGQAPVLNLVLTTITQGNLQAHFDQPHK
ncbi:MAG TPA: hypothetical protein VES67_26370, partial [Vicinamibacterales bacterium]|nr:hypothetical protein [Vicinamibacterales bacterium]